MTSIRYQHDPAAPSETLDVEDHEAAATIAQITAAGCILLEDYQLDPHTAAVRNEASHNRLL